MIDTAENDAPCTPESPSCEAHRNGRSWMLTCPQPSEEAVAALSEALYDAGLEEILGIPDEALDDVARVVLSLGYVFPPGRTEA